MKSKKDLLELKSEIEDAKTNVAELKGKLKYFMEQLQTLYDCSTVEEAKKKAIQLTKKVEKLKDQIEIDTKNLEEKYELTDE